jgi:broad specificity phosphatase PhoE
LAPNEEVAIVKALIVLILILTGVNVAADSTYSVYLIRHAEKDLSDPDTKNPKLRQCGEKRALRLATIFKDINLQAVYSTDFKRTQSTAKPTAKSKNITVKSYDPYKLDDLHSELTSNKQDVLVVGHSQTTTLLAGKLAGLNLEILDEYEYDRLYQVVVYEGAVEFQLLHQAFQCEK